MHGHPSVKIDRLLNKKTSIKVFSFFILSFILDERMEMFVSSIVIEIILLFIF